MIYYTEVNQSGNIVQVRFTIDPDTPVVEGHRLVADIVPVYNSNTQIVSRVEPVLPDQNEVQYIITDIPIDPLRVDREIRRERNTRLLMTDWVMLSDSPIKDNAELLYQWTKYRQALRDITSLPGYPNDVIFPIPPEGYEDTNLGIRL